MPVAWMWPIGCAQIHTSRQAGGIASAAIRAITSGFSIRSPASSRYSKPRPRRRRVIPGPEQSTRFSRGMTAEGARVRSRLNLAGHREQLAEDRGRRCGDDARAHRQLERHRQRVVTRVRERHRAARLANDQLPGRPVDRARRPQADQTVEPARRHVAQRKHYPAGDSQPSPRPSRCARAAVGGRGAEASRARSVTRRENAGQSGWGERMARRILGSMPSRAEGVTEPQLEAIAHRGGPALVIGGAGTGKTRTLCERFASLVREGTGPDAVLLLTRSGGLSARMRSSIEASIETPFEELWLEHFQGFCTRLLRAEAVEAGVDPLFAPFTRADRLAPMLDRIDELTLRRHEIRGNPAPLLAAFLARIDRLKLEMVRPAEYRAHAERLADEAYDDAARAHARRELEFAELYADHETLLRACGALDSGDLVLGAFDLLHRKPHVRMRVAQRFEHV